MSRRASLPGASELFRRTSSPGTVNPALDQPALAEPSSRAQQGRGKEVTPERERTAGAGSGKQRHDSKITVYLSGDEVLAMEQARLTLRGTHALPVDRGRIVREAVAVLLEDFDQNGEESVLVRRLRGQRTEN